ncbi:MAG: acetylxylan esterase [Bacteroidales bacterium]|nr:acetylxylan esterase [Bacteroidales bacterium]
MKLIFISLIFILLIGCNSGKSPQPGQDEIKIEEAGKAELKKLESMYSNKEQWEARKVVLREEILKGINLFPLPSKTPLNAVISAKRNYDGYSVENVYFESIPGYFVCGNLYRPSVDTKKHPAVLCPHGHFQGDTLGAWGRFRPDQQKRCATFARMGAVVFSYGMYSWGGEPVWQLDTTVVIEKPDKEVIRKNHESPLSVTMQTWSSIRAVDFLESLPDVDMSEVAVTGASGGGTQSFLLAAVDDRISVSIPVVMVSCHYKDLCVCEKVMPSGNNPDQILNMAEFAAMIAPKPMLLVSDGDDWTRNTPKVEYPFIRRTYSFFNAENNVENAHFPDGVHDYGFEKRVPVYRFLSKHMGLNMSAITDTGGNIDESKSVLENPEKLLAFSTQNPIPPNALKGSAAIEKELKALQK